MKMLATIFKRSVARFRRWNRARYSAFASLHLCVTIGALRAEIEDASLRKNGHALSNRQLRELFFATAFSRWLSERCIFITLAKRAFSADGNVYGFLYHTNGDNHLIL